MVLGKRVLGVIPARGGSKAIPNKNIAAVAGYPLLYWTVRVAHGTGILDRLILSTDSETIADSGRMLGVSVPFRRPDHLATDESSTFDVIKHALSWTIDNDDNPPDIVLCLQPTSPLRGAADILESVALLVERDLDSVVGIVQTDRHPYWMKRINSNGYLEDFMPGASLLRNRRQDLPDVYSLNGAIFAMKASVMLQNDGWYTGKTGGYLMPQERSLDIDSSWDLKIADLTLRDLGKEL